LKQLGHPGEMSAWPNFDISRTAERAISDQGHYKQLCPHHLVSTLVKAVMFLSDGKGKLQLQALICTIAGLNLGLLFSHSRSSQLRVTVCTWVCVCFMY